MVEGPDTIAAIATARGCGGIGIVRLSGPRAAPIGAAIAGDLPGARVAGLRSFHDRDGRAIDRGLVLFFPAPASYTGEDVVELHGHGGPAVLDLLLSAAIAHGARLARPGEFTERAFLNGRMDLARAEAVADLISADSAQAARAAFASLEGALSRRIEALVEAVLDLRTHIEATLDFADEEIDALPEPTLQAQLGALIERIAGVEREAEGGRALREGYTVVIAGAPNAGKSSVMNRLAGRDTAIVTEIPGTTRDLLRETITLEGVSVHLIDTAGLRESDDPVEREGVRRARAALERADHVLVVIDDAEPAVIADAWPGVPHTVLYNKIDRTGRAPGRVAGHTPAAFGVCALSGAGFEVLREYLRSCSGAPGSGEGLFTARRRHLDALRHAREAVERARSAPGIELIAEELRLTQRALGEITGEVTTEDLLGRIFAGFCVGK